MTPRASPGASAADPASDPVASELNEEERLHQVWNNLRLVAVDTETTGSGAEVRVVAIAAITMRRQMVTGSWGGLVNPEVRISKRTIEVHGVTDAHVRTEPTFAEIRDQFLSTLTPADDDELVVLVAHKAAYDLGVLRTELERNPDADGVVHELPDIAVLDTWSKAFHVAAGIRKMPGGISLPAVAQHLGVAHVAAHNATGDALATVQIADVLIARAVQLGHATFESIHATAGGLTTRDHPTSTVIRGGRRVVTMSEVHAATHTRTLPAKPTEAGWEQWVADVTTCVLSACPRLTDRLQAAAYTVEHNRRLASLARRLAAPAEGGVPAAGLNTLAHAVRDNLHRAISPRDTPTEQRNHARNLLTRWAAVLDSIDRCGSAGAGTNRCPGCTAEEECGRDIWWRGLIPALRGRFPKVPAPVTRRGAAADRTRASRRAALNTVEGWFRPDRSAATVLVTTAKHHRVVGNYAVWTVIEWHLEHGRTDEADNLAALAVAHGYLDPRTVNHHLTRLTAARRAGDVAAAIDICSTALATRDHSTDTGWNLLTSRAAHLSGLQQRLGVSYHDQVDEDGNLIAKRRHHPETPRRTRPLRFARSAEPAKPDQPGNWVRINGAARHLHTTTQQVTKLAAAGKFTAKTVDGVDWFDIADLDAYTASTRVVEKKVPPPKAEPRKKPKQAKRALVKQKKVPRPGGHDLGSSDAQDPTEDPVQAPPAQ